MISQGLTMYNHHIFEALQHLVQARGSSFEAGSGKAYPDAVKMAGISGWRQDCDCASPAVDAGRLRHSEGVVRSSFTSAVRLSPSLAPDPRCGPRPRSVRPCIGVPLSRQAPAGRIRQIGPRP